MADITTLVDTGGAEIFVRVEGEGPPLVLVHGLGMSSELWVHQQPALTPYFQTFAVDLRGFGRSSKPDEPDAYAIETLARDLIAVIEHFDIAGCHFLGTSMGGFVAQALTLARPDLVGTLLLCHTAPRMSIPADVLASRVEALSKMTLAEYAPIVVEQALSPNAGRELQQWLTDLLIQNDKRAYTQVLTEGLSEFDVGEQINAIEQRTLVITGELDRVLPREGGREIARTIPNASYAEIPAVGHIGYAENPGRFNRLVIDFLNG